MENKQKLDEREENNTCQHVFHILSCFNIVPNDDGLNPKSILLILIKICFLCIYNSIIMFLTFSFTKFTFPSPYIVYFTCVLF